MSSEKKSHPILLTMSIILNIVLILVVIFGYIQTSKDEYLKFSIASIEQTSTSYFKVYIGIENNTSHRKSINEEDFSILVNHTPESVTIGSYKEGFFDIYPNIKKTIYIVVYKDYDFLEKPITITYLGQSFTYENPLIYNVEKY